MEKRLGRPRICSVPLGLDGHSRFVRGTQEARPGAAEHVSSEGPSSRSFSVFDRDVKHGRSWASPRKMVVGVGPGWRPPSELRGRLEASALSWPTPVVEFSRVIHFPPNGLNIQTLVPAHRLFIIREGAACGLQAIGCERN